MRNSQLCMAMLAICNSPDFKMAQLKLAFLRAQTHLPAPDRLYGRNGTTLHSHHYNNVRPRPTPARSHGFAPPSHPPRKRGYDRSPGKFY